VPNPTQPLWCGRPLHRVPLARIACLPAWTAGRRRRRHGRTGCGAGGDWRLRGVPRRDRVTAV